MIANRTALERIEAEIEIGIGRALVDLFYDIELGLHTGKGFYPDCACEYCEAKRQETFNVAHCLQNVRFGRPKDPNDQIYGSCGSKYTEHWLLAFNVRERVRKGARERLLQIKNEAR